MANDNWPPRSPHDVLLYTPGGRERLKRLADRGSPSPSPSKRPASSALNRRKMLPDEDVGLGGSEDDDDEETLQLQLQEIQARLKLKKLQKKSKQGSDTEDGTRSGSTTLGRSSSVAALGRTQSRVDLRAEKDRLERSKSRNEVHVPMSPVRREQPAIVQRSPSRILLGIDKGLRGSDVSLKRAPSQRKPQEDLRGPFLQRPASQVSGRVSRPGTSASESIHEEAPKTFSERMASMRTQDNARQERDLRIQKKRSSNFDIDEKKMQQYKESAVELPPARRQAPEFSRDDVLGVVDKPSRAMPRSKTAPDLQSAGRTSSNATHTSASSSRSGSLVSTDLPKQRNTSKSGTKPGDVTESEASSFEPFSSVHLKKRIIPHKELTRLLKGKQTYVVPDLLREVKGPDFSGPDIEEDVVLFGIIASKTDPKAHQNNTNNAGRGKFMVMTITDLKWELDLFLFGSAFDKFWKLTTGTIIAILNPGFMAPKRGQEATNKFSLTLNSDADTILEVGSARDLGFCKAVKKDGKTCDAWVDNRHTEFCSFHVNLALEKTHANRMEVNSMNFGRGKGRGGGMGDKKYGGEGNPYKRKDIKIDDGSRYDRASHSQIYSAGRGTSSLLGGMAHDSDSLFNGGTKEERIMRRNIEKEKEREIEKRLSSIGNGIGADYMRKRSGQPIDNGSNMLPAAPPRDAAALGLLSGKGKDVDLGPV